jgi:DNA-binding NarL/FixJ family response regulator
VKSLHAKQSKPEPPSMPVDDGGQRRSPTPAGDWMSGARPIRTLVAQAEASIRGVLTWLLDQDPRFAVVASVGTGGEAASWAGAIDAALVDLAVPGLDALKTVRALRDHHPDATVVVLATVDGPYLRAAARAAGAHGYVDRSRGQADFAQLLADLCSESRPQTR